MSRGVWAAAARQRVTPRRRGWGGGGGSGEVGDRLGEGRRAGQNEEGRVEEREALLTHPSYFRRLRRRTQVSHLPGI